MSARRALLQSLALGCAGLLGWQWCPQTPEPAGESGTTADLDLALRVVRAAGTVAAAWPRQSVRLAAPVAAHSIPQLLAAVFGATTVHAATQLSTAELQQLLALRIQQDYQTGALVRCQGWWLAYSEAAILELGCRLAGGSL